jgi:fructokinase
MKEETDCFYFGTLAQRSEVSRKTIQSFFNKGAKYFFDLNLRQNFFNKEVIDLSLKTADVLKVNLDELKTLNELFLNKPFETNKVSEEVMKKFKIEMLAVTLGSEGSALFKNDEVDYYKPDPVDIIDTVGAGDAFASILCIGFLQKWNLKKVNKLANNFATEICRLKGALPADDAVYDFIKEEVRDD